MISNIFRFLAKHTLIHFNRLIVQYVSYIFINEKHLSIKKT